MIEIPVVYEYGYRHYVWRMPSLAEAIKAWKAKKGPLSRERVGELEEVDQPWWFRLNGDKFGCLETCFIHVHTENDSWFSVADYGYEHPDYVQARA
jgi:hypothetical protein